MRISIDVDPVEIRALLCPANCWISSMPKGNHFWNLDSMRRFAVLTAAMIQKRFAHIFQFITFDDKSNVINEGQTII